MVKGRSRNRRKTKYTYRYAKKKFQYRFKCEHCGNDSGWLDAFISAQGSAQGRNENSKSMAADNARANLNKRLEEISKGQYYLLNEKKASLKKALRNAKGICPSCRKFQTWSIYPEPNKGILFNSALAGFLISLVISILLYSISRSYGAGAIMILVLTLIGAAIAFLRGLIIVSSNKKILLELENVKEKQVPETMWDSEFEITERLKK